MASTKDSKKAPRASDSHKNEKLRVFREQAKMEKSGRGRATSPKQYEAERKGQDDRRKKLGSGKPKPKSY